MKVGGRNWWVGAVPLASPRSSQQKSEKYLGIAFFGSTLARKTHHLGHVIPPEIATTPSGRLWHGETGEAVNSPTFVLDIFLDVCLVTWMAKLRNQRVVYCMNNRQRGVFRQRKNSSVSRKQCFSKLRSYPCPCFDDETNLRSGTRFVWVPHGSCCYSISTSIRHAAIFTPSREMADLIMRFWPGVAVGVATSRQARAFALQMGSSFSIASPWCRGAPVRHGTCSSGPSGPRLRSFSFLLRRLTLSDWTNLNWLVKPPPIKPTYHTTGFTPDYVPMTSHDSQS